jgi:hypothetical protein
MGDTNRGLNHLGLLLPNEILTVHKKESADCNQYEQPHALLILALYYREKMIQIYGELRTEEIIAKYRNMNYAKSDSIKKDRIEAQRHAEERRDAKLKLMVEAGKRAEIRIEQRNRELNLEEKKLQQEQKPKRDKAWEKQIAEGEALGIFKNKPEAPKPTPTPLNEFVKNVESAKNEE